MSTELSMVEGGLCPCSKLIVEPSYEHCFSFETKTFSTRHTYQAFYTTE